MRQRPVKFQYVNGDHVVLVPIGSFKDKRSGNQRYATIYQSDYNLLIRLGANFNWFITSSGTVGFHSPGGHLFRIARLIANAGEGEKVTYIDGDNLNLRRTNLRLVKGHGSYNEREKLAETQRDHREKYQSNILLHE